MSEYYEIELAPNNKKDIPQLSLRGRLRWEEDAGEVMLLCEFDWGQVGKNAGIRQIAGSVALLDETLRRLAAHGFSVLPAEGADDAGATHLTEEDYPQGRAPEEDWGS